MVRMFDPGELRRVVQMHETSYRLLMIQIAATSSPALPR